MLQQYGPRARGWFLSLSPVKRDVLIFVAMVLVSWFHLFIMSNIMATFHHNAKGEYVAFSEDTIFHVYWLAIIPFTITFLLRNQRSLQALQGNLAAQGIRVQSISTAKLFLRILFFTVVGTAIFTWSAIAHQGYRHWWEAQFSGAYVFLHFFSCCVLAAATALTCICYTGKFAKGISRQLTQGRRLVIEVYHPDGCGGLFWISRPFLNLVVFCILVCMAGLITVLDYCWDRGYTWRHPFILLNIAWPMVFGPITTFLIVQSTGIRRYLIEDKKRRLYMLSWRISNELARMLPNEETFMRSEQTENEDGRLARALTMIDLYAKLEKAFPVWPIPRHVIGLAAMSGPAISLLGSLVAIVSTLFQVSGK